MALSPEELHAIQEGLTDWIGSHESEQELRGLVIVVESLDGTAKAVSREEARKHLEMMQAAAIFRGGDPSALSRAAKELEAAPPSVIPCILLIERPNGALETGFISAKATSRKN